MHCMYAFKTQMLAVPLYSDLQLHISLGTRQVVMGVCLETSLVLCAVGPTDSSTPCSYGVDLSPCVDLYVGT